MRLAAGVALVLSGVLAGSAAAQETFLPAQALAYGAGHSPHWGHTQHQIRIPRPHIIPPMELYRPGYIWNGVHVQKQPTPYPYEPYGTPFGNITRPYYAYGIPYSGHPGFYQFFYPHVMVYRAPVAGPVVSYTGYGYYERPNAITVPTGATSSTTTNAPAAPAIEGETVEEVEVAPQPDALPEDKTIPPLDDVKPQPAPSQPVPGEANRGSAKVARK